jgi:hypothetical protein
MGSDVAPLLIGFAAAGVLLVLVGLVLAARHLFERRRLRPRHRATSGEGRGTSQEWVYGRHAPREGQPDSFGRPSDVEAAVEEGERKAEETLAAAERQSEDLRRESEAEAERTAVEITENARRQARELLENAEVEAGEIVTAAERQSENLRRESEAEAERTAVEITEIARGQARELLEEAELEANGILAHAGQERARLLNELARERALVVETRMRLSSFLVDVLEEVEGAVSEGAANVRDLNEARGAKTSAGANR